MEIEIKQGVNKFFVGEEDHPLALVTYSPVKGKKSWILDHTFVDPSLRGQQLGNKLVAKVVALAREKGYKIVPLCSFAVYEFQRKPEYADIHDTETDPGEGPACQI